MKKTIWLGVLLASATMAAGAQESRQDVSISGFGLWAPVVHGNGITETSSKTTGVLASYRYLLTPRSGLEVNYSFAQNSNYYMAGFLGANRYPVATRQQEATVAYVYGLNFRNFNPFVEAGIGGTFFTPIQQGSYTLDAKSNTRPTGLVGIGLAYEISPSFDVRAEYRGTILKAPTFVSPTFNTNAYTFISMPSIGVAYHF